MKKDEANNYYTVLKRKSGAMLTWVILKLFPSISANFVTLSMLPLNLLAAGMLYYAIVSFNLLFLFISLLISFFTLSLDSVDGNIARIKKTASIKGVFFDRLVHNICHPLYFFIIGFAFYETSNQIAYLIIFLIVGLLSELSPFDISQKDVEALFIRQAVYHNTITYNYESHKNRDYKKQHTTNHFKSTVRKWITTILMNDFFYLMILLDMLIFDKQYYFTVFLAFVDIIGMIYVRANINRWENNLSEVLERLTVYKN